MNPGIFREYDIRGIVGEDFTLEEMERLGRGYGTFLRAMGGKSVVLGRDCRLSSPMIRDAMVEGLLGSGLDVVDVGMCPTPVLYFSLRHLRVEGGLMITASHNPPQYNGLKVCVGTETIFGEQLQELRRTVEAGRFSSGKGRLSKYDILTPYSQHLKGNLRLERPVRLAVDCGNGTAGLTAGTVLGALGCTPVELFMEPDGRFPNHDPDPTLLENLSHMRQVVLEEELELGIAFDGDGDRLGVVDQRGEVIPGDMLMVIFARDILRTKPGATFIGEVKCSQRMYDEISARGGRALMWKTGHSLIKSKMKEEKAVLAGEMSGHLFFADRYFGYDDALYAACRLLEILSRDHKPLSSYLEELPPAVATPEIRVPCPEEKKFGVVEKVRDFFKKQYTVIDIDGARVLFRDGWGLVRASNTSPVLVLRFEAKDPGRLEEIRALVEEAVENAMGEGG